VYVKKGYESTCKDGEIVSYGTVYKVSFRCQINMHDTSATYIFWDYFFTLICLAADIRQLYGLWSANKYLSEFNYIVYQSNTGYLWVCIEWRGAFDGKRYHNFCSDYLSKFSY
jgi:hypothetical protein